MQIKQIKINHIERPLGYYLYSSPVVSFKIENSDNYEVVEIYIEVYEKCGERITLSNGENEFNTIISSEKYLELKTVYPLPIKLKPRTEYMVTIKAINEIGELATEGSYFETGKMDECWQGKWIAPENEEIPNPQLSKKILIRKSVKSARAYVGCSGLYRLMINDKKVGKEFLTPYCNDYHSWRQIITHDITDYLHIGENLLSFTLAKGWFMGSFSLTRSNNIYGHKMSLITELHVEYTDGERQVFCSDDSWMCTKSEFEKAEIYDGAVMNYRISCSEYKKVCCIE
jgi:alpha-L-rhamnosidase